MSDTAVTRAELIVRTIAQTAVDNEKYFCDLDAVVGDGDFGYSLARGFELVIRDWDGFDRTDTATFLRKVALVVTSRVGGTSGPLWRTAFLRVPPPPPAGPTWTVAPPWPCCGRPPRGSRPAATPASATRASRRACSPTGAPRGPATW